MYERLDKHCTKCLRLDHELKECLVARTEAKALKASQEEERGSLNRKSGQESDSIRRYSSGHAHENQLGEQEHKKPVHFGFEAHQKGSERERRTDNVSRGQFQNITYKAQTSSWQERSSHRRSYQSRERARLESERVSRLRHEGPIQRNRPAPPSRSYYREVQKHIPEHRDTDSSASKSHHEESLRGNPHRSEHDLRPHLQEHVERRPECYDTLP